MTADDRKLVQRLLEVKDQACDQIASLILSAYLDPESVMASVEDVKLRLEVETIFESVDDVLATARELGHALLAMHGNV